MKEKRRFRRLKTHIETSYTKVEGFATINSLGVTDDISATGMSTALSKIIKRGDDLLLELRSQYNSDKRIAILAKVVWAKSVNDNIHNKCGLKFLWVSSKSLLGDCIARGGLSAA